MSVKKNSVKRVAVIPDLHFPLEDRKSLKAVEDYLESHKWDHAIMLGDVMDFGQISSHNVTNLRAVEGKTIQADYDYTNDALDRIQKKLNGASITMIEGNHDYRIERYIDQFPRLKGSIEVEKGLSLKKRGIEWVRNWSTGKMFTYGKANFIHGLYTNEHHAKKTVQAYGKNIFYAHSHDVQQFSQVQQGDDDTIVGQSFGCLCEYAQDYMRGKPNKWQQAFGTFYFQPDGFFNHYVTRIFNHTFISPEGDLFRG